MPDTLTDGSADRIAAVSAAGDPVQTTLVAAVTNVAKAAARRDMAEL